jgi:hypothetical protein
MTTTVGITSENNTRVTQRLGTLDLTRPEDLPQAVFRQKLQVLDLLVERMATSGNPRFVVQYLALLQEVENTLAAILERRGAPVSAYLAPAPETTPTPASGKQSHPPKAAAQPATNGGTEPAVGREPSDNHRPQRGMALPPLIAEVLHTQAELGQLPVSYPCLAVTTPRAGQAGARSGFSPYRPLIEPRRALTTPAPGHRRNQADRAGQ